MAEEVRAPQPQNPAVDPELPQPPPPQQVESRSPADFTPDGALIVPIVVQQGPRVREADPVAEGTTSFFGEPETQPQFFGGPEVFQPIGFALDGDPGIGRTFDFQDPSPGRTTLFVDPEEDPGTGGPEFNEAGAEIGSRRFFGGPDPVSPAEDPEAAAAEGTTTTGFDGAAPPFLPNEDAQAANDTVAALREAQDQSTTQQRFNQTTDGDWRLRIRLLNGANYLYKALGGAQDILAPLAASDGVIFPYTPTVTTNYRANYQTYDLTHSNIRGYFYQNSHVGEIGINGTFTAQDTKEAAYLLAVIHFFRSVTKMFYGQDQFRGAPPPVVTLSGYGQYQFNEHPCLVQNFNYSLPSDVDYIRVNPNNQGLNLAPRQPRSSMNRLSLSSVINRLTNARIPVGAETDLGFVEQTVNGTGQTSYVPTRMDIQLTLLPLQTRSQVSKQFSLKAFASGSLLSKGFW